MRSNLYARPRPRRRRRWWVWLLVLLLILMLGILARQQGWLPEAAMAQLEQGLRETMPASLAEVAELAVPPESREGVVLMSSDVVQNPGSPAYTAEFHARSITRTRRAWSEVEITPVQTYVVQPGDSLWGIALEYDTTLDRLRWSNPVLAQNPDVLRVGTELVLPPPYALYHRVGPGETLGSVAAAYGVSELDLVNYPPNELEPPYDLERGQGLIIPHGTRDLTPQKPALAPEFTLAWPVVGPVVETGPPATPTLTLAAPFGSAVYAAAAGTVLYADWSQGAYGYTVIIDHGDGLQTHYSHLRGVTLPADSLVSRGEVIGTVGSLGDTLGPHLRFAVYAEGQPANPRQFMPPEPQ